MVGSAYSSSLAKTVFGRIRSFSEMVSNTSACQLFGFTAALPRQVTPSDHATPSRKHARRICRTNLRMDPWPVPDRMIGPDKSLRYPCQQVDDQPNHELLARRRTLGDQQRQRGQCLGVNPMVNRLLPEEEEEQ